MSLQLLSIDKIGLSNRTLNALHRANINTVGELVMCSEEFLSEIRFMGRKSVDEALSKIAEYKQKEQAEIQVECQGDTRVLTQDWSNNPDERKLLVDYLKTQEKKIDALDLLPAKAYNLLTWNGYDYIYQLLACDEDALLGIPRMDETTLNQIKRSMETYIDNLIEEINRNNGMQKDGKLRQDVTIYELFYDIENHDVLLDYVKKNDIDISRLELSNRPKNRLQASNYKKLSDFIFCSEADFMKIPSMGKGSVDEIMSLINSYILKNEDRMRKVIAGDLNALLSDENLKTSVLSFYDEKGFYGYSYDEFCEKMAFLGVKDIQLVKRIIGELLAEGELEYVDYRCYRVYSKFGDFLKQAKNIEDRTKEILSYRIQGKTLEEVGQIYDLTRERIRQIAKNSIGKIYAEYESKLGKKWFDEDYYRYFYATYEVDKRDAISWLGIPNSVFTYMNLCEIKPGKRNIQEALDDSKLDLSLRLKIKNFLHRDELFIDGNWVKKKRAALEQVVVQKFCKDSVSFSDFIEVYNRFLNEIGIGLDENLYYTDDVIRTRENRLLESKFLLWKQNKQLRAYDIDGQDFTALLDELNLGSYENIEISTLKLIRDHEDIMREYDIRDQYELHNLLRKIIPEGSYNNFQCGRTPMIKFGNFDRDEDLLELLINNAPISANDFANLINEEYGYDQGVTIGSYLQPFSVYYHQGMYEINQKVMPADNVVLLKAALTEEFYLIDDIKDIYRKIIPNADVQEINPYNLKNMGLTVLSRYVLQNHTSLDSYFEELFTKEDIIDLTVYRNRYTYIQTYYIKLSELKRNLTVVEFEPNQLINFRKLADAGVTREMIQKYCDDVYDLLPDNLYFTAKTIRVSEYKSDLYDLGFSDIFYTNLLMSDKRFSVVGMFGTYVLYKGKKNITAKDFISNIINKHGCIDTYDLLSELECTYGCTVSDKWDIITKLEGTRIYYDKILDRFYANEDIFYQEIELDGVL